MAVPQEVFNLIERFDRNCKAYQSGQYNETQVRREFLDPFFETLGWDVNNKQGYAEAYKDVVHEDAIKVGGLTKAPDYCFRIGGTRKFFLEAKKPAINIRSDISPAFQLRRYAWSAKLPLSILSDFQEFAVYDCRIKPDKVDKASTARTFYFTYTEYIERWDEIISIFSRDAILKGSFDKYAESNKVKRGTAEVDAAFLKEIETWRELLALNLALRNPGLTQRELNFAVQRTIDRIIFLRICDDRGIEEYGRLMALQNGVHIYPHLCQLFHRADERYNSGLFHFQSEKDSPEPPDSLTLSLTIDDKPLKQIIKGLYYPDSPYEFSVLPADILGQVYEQFLGKVIRLTPGHRAVVEDKPEVKKAGGVYYTPTYIVDYIVQYTVGKLLEGKKPGPRGGVSKLRILDCACGSGSFLLGAYQYLLDWHRDQYVADGPQNHLKELYQGPGGDWRLTTAEGKRILLNNIYGVDIDLQAVEMTKLSLLLKVLEGESEQTLARQLQLFHERALPNLGSNIKCGNSLIGSNFYDNDQMSLLSEEEHYRINVFDWESEFPEIIQSEGFDAVIGNPPYVRQEVLGENFKRYAKQNFSSYAGTADLYVYFIEQSHRLLCPGGYFGMICSNKFMRANYGKALRTFLTKETKLRQIIDFGELPVFQKASTFPAIILTQKGSTPKQQFTYAPIKQLSFQSLIKEVEKTGTKLDNRSIADANWTLARSEEVAILEKMKQIGLPLGEYVKDGICYGIKTGLNEAFVIDRATRDRLISEDPKSAELIKPFIVGDDVRKYHINFREKYLILIPKGWTRNQSSGTRNVWRWFQNNYPAIASHLSPHAAKAEKRYDKGEYWWELRECDYYAEFEKPKIIYPDIAKQSRVAFDPHGLYLANTIYFINTDNLYLLGLLNSKLLFTYYKRSATIIGDADRGGRLRWFRQDVVKLPIYPIDFSNSTDKALHDRLVQLVERMLLLNKQLVEARTSHDQTILQRQIDGTDRQIDRLVYELYGLTDEEIAIVEEANRR